MKRLVAATIILLIATVLITIVYFKNLNTPGQQTSQVMTLIPEDASLILEINNDKSFYDIFSDFKLFTVITGREQMDDLDTLRKQLLMNALLAPYLDGQNIYISLHPVTTGEPGWLLTLSASKEFKIALLDQMVNRPESKLIIQTQQFNSKTEYSVYLKSLKKRFYFVDKGDNVFSGSFSKDLAEKAAAYENKKHIQHFTLMPERQNLNALANLYINYSQLSPLFEQLFSAKNTDILKGVRLLPATAALTLNYKSDALLFSGTSTIQARPAVSYFNLFSNQQPVANHLKDLFPSTTAYSVSFAVSDPKKFADDLAAFHIQAGLEKEKTTLFNKIRTETGVKIKPEFDKLLGNEFAIITTRYQEKIAIIQLKNGLQLRPLMVNISNMINDDVGQFKYEKIPFFLIGDAFNVLKRPYFRLIDNYLVLANSPAELASYYDSYNHHKFLSKLDDYMRFDNLLAEKSNVTCFFNFKNLQHVFKLILKPATYAAFENNTPGWKDFYGASYQLSSANKNYYTNFCLQLEQPDTTQTPLVDN